MPSLERFFDPQMRKFDANIRPLPGARLYFFDNNTTTPKAVYQDKQGSLAHTNPVIADEIGAFPPIFLDGLYSVELRSNKNIVQPGWPINNIGQDTPVVPFGPWNEINTYNTGEVVTAPNGNWYRSITDNNLGNDPISSPSEWEVIPIPVASSFTSNKSYLTWADDGDQVSLNVDINGMTDEIEANITGTDGDFTVGGDLTVGGQQLQIGQDAGPKYFIDEYGEVSNDGVSYSPIKTTANDEIVFDLPLLNGYTGSLKTKVDDRTIYIYGQVISPGAIVGPTPYNTIATLPAGYRPESNIRCVAQHREVSDPFTPEIAHIQITTDGSINWYSAVATRIVDISIMAFQ